MPDFDARYPGKLEGSLGQPFAKYGNTYFHRGLLRKAIAYFYYCTKDHPFENGNKRFAVTIMLFFLAKNDMWLDLDPTYLYEVAKAVADDKSRPEEVMAKLYDAFKSNFESYDSAA
jgi:death-on-curing protein